jgi:hypothetical protein
MYNENYAQEWSDQQDNSEWQVPCMMLVPVANDQGEVQDTHYFPFSSSINDSGANGDGATANKDESDPISAKTRKDVMKLRKKLREIERIKERLEDGGKVDSFQMAKLEKREEILADIARLEEQDNGKAVDAGDGYFFDGMTVGVNEETADAESQWLGQAYAIMDNDAGQAPWMMWAPIAGADLDAQQNDIQEGVFFPSSLMVASDDYDYEVPEWQQLGEQEDTHLTLIEQAQQQAEARAAKEASCSGRRRRKYIGGMSRAGFAEHVSMLTKALDAGGSDAEEALAIISEMSVILALDAAGCRLLQQALDIADALADINLLMQLIEGLKGHVREAINSPHGNYVIQKIVEVVPLSQASFVARELLGSGSNIARHRFGCRVLCRILERFGSAAKEGQEDEAVAELLQEVITDSIDLSRHNFGHHVLQSLLDHGKRAQREEVIRKLCRDLPRNLKTRNAGFVFEKLLTECSVEERSLVFDRLAAGGSEVRAALAQSGRTGARICRLLKSYLGEVASSPVEATTSKKPPLRDNKGEFYAEVDAEALVGA